MEESELRKLAAKYLNRKFSKHKIIVPFLAFHKEGMTLSRYLRKKFFGEELRKLNITIIVFPKPIPKPILTYLFSKLVGVFMQLGEPVVKIENVVACAALEHGIDLSSVVKAFPVVDYRPERFPGLVFKLKSPRTTILI